MLLGLDGFEVGFFAFDQNLGAIQLLAGAILLIGVYLVVKSETTA